MAGYLAAILALSFYVRRRIGVRLWRRMHRFTVVVYVLALGHSLGSGTDASIPLVRDAMLASTLPVLFLFALRLQRTRTRGRTAASGPERRTDRRPQVDPPARGGVPGATPPRAPTPGRQPSGRSRPTPLGQLEAHPSQAN